MSPSPTPPVGLHFVAETPVSGLAVAEHRVTHPLATLICVHGGLDRGGSFARLARRLDVFNLVAYDRRGYQRSRSLQPLRLDLHVADLIAVIRREKEGGPVILFGHSYGGVVVLAAALEEPSLADLVVAYESPLPWILSRPSSRPSLTRDAGAEAERFFRRMVSNSAWDRLSERERESRRLDGPALLSDLNSLHTGQALFDLAQLKTPAAYVYGDGILHEYYHNLSMKLNVINPNLTIHELQNASHGVHLTSPDQFAMVLEELWRQTCALA